MSLYISIVMPYGIKFWTFAYNVLYNRYVLPKKLYYKRELSAGERIYQTSFYSDLKPGEVKKLLKKPGKTLAE